MYYRVRALDNFSTGKKENISSFLDNPLFEFIEGDICDFETCSKACQGIDYVWQKARSTQYLCSCDSDFCKKAFSNGTHSRDFTYVDNVIEANLKACLAPPEACGKAYNIAFGENTSLYILYKKLCRLLDKDIEPIYGPERVVDVKHSLADISQAKAMIGYAPLYDLAAGLEKAIDWYKEYLV